MVEGSEVPPSRGSGRDEGFRIALSIVIPAFNEMGNIKPLVERLVPVLASLGAAFEVIFVDDGSSDGTWTRISEVAAEVPAISGVRLSRNFGHQHALLAGMSIARGDAVVSMDADLQHPPEVIPELFKRWSSGDKIVFTRRRHDKHLGFFKRVSSRYFYRVFSSLSGVPMTEGSSDFRLIDRQVLNELLRFQDVDLFLRGAVQWLGFRDAASTVEFSVGERYAEASKYTIHRMIGFASRAVVSFSTKPLIIGIWLGVATGVLAFLELAYILYQVMRGVTVPGWASTVGIVALLFGVLFVILGVIGTYLASIHSALQRRPKFVVEAMTPALRARTDQADVQDTRGQ